jgi:alkylhydroperoxidase/carboxymuconolactone decarboxylase family protein YurZ
MAEFLESETALTISEKSLFAGAISATKGRASDTTAWLKKALGAGLAPAAAQHAANLMLLSRGLEVSRLMIESIPESKEIAVEIEAAPTPSRDEIFDYFTTVFGSLPARVSLLGEHVPAALVYYHLLRRSGLETGSLKPRISELMLVAVNAAEYQRDYIRIHAEGALKKGATEAQLVEACVCAIPFAGVAAWFPASEAILSLRP